ncbi:helix-turn-helix domain-containing protein [Erwinia sp. BNK-24-b]|uniref:HVO_A0114 family putative DNA-binding protein n=1 Tax=Erwinia TaxID=551 RepID=UPI001FEF4E46|nr:MarR family transcriptional regulator [Erwinia phyllosphaerae]
MKALIGIMPENEFRARIMAIVRKEYVPAEDEPKIWFSSLNAVAQILSPENLELLDLIDREKPESISRLAELSGRAKSNLSATLTTLAKHGFVKKVKGNNCIKPVAIFTEFDIRTARFPPRKASAAA